MIIIRADIYIYIYRSLDLKLQLRNIIDKNVNSNCYWRVTPSNDNFTSLSESARGKAVVDCPIKMYANLWVLYKSILQLSEI